MPIKIRIRRRKTARGALQTDSAKRARKNGFAGEAKQDDIVRRALRISIDAAELGFDWSDAAGVHAKLCEEVGEIGEALACPQYEGHLGDEIGDLFFALVNFARKANISPETAFERGVRKFERRFAALKKIARSLGYRIESLDADALNALWDRVKKEECPS